ncbi:MAG: hypothetical protein A2166_02670 [Omnitrophica WOR_2 bacterium RBG_13_41_10]|nr:MAG: hypothetical protein A2166_02670 [Omnitrophica WOR_2 bacterium RBG_13_41_10]
MNRKKINKIIKNSIPILVILFISIILFLNENFFTPGTIRNYGDDVFPLRQDYINTYLYSWDSRLGYGLGHPSLFPVFLPTYLLINILSFLGIPLWIINRLYLIGPNILIGFGALYLYRSLFKGKYSWLGGIIASIFIILPPEKFPIPVYEIGFGSTLFFVGGLIRALFWKKTRGKGRGKLFILVILMTALSAQCIRYFYISIIIGIFLTAFSFYYYRKDKERIKMNIRFLIIAIVIAIFINSFWLVPFFFQLNDLSESHFSDPETLSFRLKHNTENQKITNPLYALRASTGGGKLGRPPDYYLSHPLVIPFSFLIPLYCFLPLLIIKIEKKLKLLTLLSTFFIVMLSSYHLFPLVNVLLRKYIPTFWIMNSPQYWAYYITVFYGLIFAGTTEYFLKKIDELRGIRLYHSYFSSRILKIIFIFCLLITIFIFNGGVIFDKAIVKGFYRPYSLYGIRLPYVRIPDEYNNIEEYLTKNAKTGDRLWYIDRGNYKKYTWLTKGHMPEIIFFKSPIPTVGLPLAFYSDIIGILSDSVAFNKYSPQESLGLVLDLSEVLNIRYILLHKDYFFWPDIDLTEYVQKAIIDNKNFKIAMDTDLFTLYENVNFPSKYIYITKDVFINTSNNIDTLPLLLQAIPGKDNTFIFSRDSQGKSDINCSYIVEYPNIFINPLVNYIRDLSYKYNLNNIDKIIYIFTKEKGYFDLTK